MSIAQNQSRKYLNNLRANNTDLRAYSEGCKRFKCRVLLTFYAAVEQRFISRKTQLTTFIAQHRCIVGKCHRR